MLHNKSDDTRPDSLAGYERSLGNDKARLCTHTVFSSPTCQQDGAWASDAPHERCHK